MLLKEGIISRRSIRKFTEEKVSHKDLEEIIEVAANAPSWKNTQVVKYVAVENKEIKDKIANECTIPWNKKHIDLAPMLIVVTYTHGISGYEKDGQPSTSKDHDWEVFDTGIATQTFCLAAHEKGLGTVIMGIFDEDKISKAIDLKEDERVGVLVAIGHPAEAPESRGRKVINEILSYK